MSIGDMCLKIKDWTRNTLFLLDRRDIYGITVLILSAAGAYYTGKLHNPDNQRPIMSLTQVEMPALKTFATEPEKDNPANSTSGSYVASKSGSKYHLPTCPGAKSIVEANKIWFASKDEAEKAGYTPAANCPGI